MTERCRARDSAGGIARRTRRLLSCQLHRAERQLKLAVLPVTLIPCARGYGDQQSLAAARNLMERLLQCISPDVCRFSDAGKTCSPRADAAGVRKAPRHEIAVGGAPGGAASAMGIWAGRACQCDLMAAVRMIALGQKIAESTLKVRPVRCASGFGVGLRAGMARRCKRGRCRASASENGGGRCGGGSMVPAS